MFNILGVYKSDKCSNSQNPVYDEIQSGGKRLECRSEISGPDLQDGGIVIQANECYGKTKNTEIKLENCAAYSTYH